MELAYSIKNKIFSLVDSGGKIMTWDSVIKRGGIGLNCCRLCKVEVEWIDQILMDCAFNI